ncbi:MAG TPA: HAMP domain-containing sensor histidine kinase [Candidatus Limnocylindria bacterium]|jgi:two-component system sensor histidine kinase MprB
MSFRLRVTLLAAGAVAVAVVGAAVLMYFVVQTQLVSQFNTTLVEAANAVRSPSGDRSPEGRFPGGPQGTLSGRSDVAAQIVNSNTGTVSRSDAQPVVALVTPNSIAVASGSAAAYFFETTLEGSHLRVWVTPGAQRGTAIEVWGPLDPIEGALAATRVRLGLVALAGVLLAAALGTLVARAALAPVQHLTSVVEEVARTRDLSRRVAASGTDELSRLAASFNEMLGALEVSLRQQRQLVADASHELRTPLTSLRTNLELLARGHPTDESERHTVLTDLVAQMERMSTLVADLIDLARDEEASLPVEDVRLDEVVADALAGVRGRYPNVLFTISSRPASIRGVRSRVSRAVTNLLDNAGKWSPAGGIVEVSVTDGEISVRDHGPGVAPEDAPHVFDRFWRASSARHLPGSGLGLSIVKDIAEKHGGSVILEQAPGGGARFRLRLAA